jgi:SnoaL-like domain
MRGGDHVHEYRRLHASNRFVTAGGAACTLLMLPGRADDELPQRRGPYRIEDWGKTWLNPNKARVLARVPAIAMPDIAGYWPQTTRPVRGPQEYAKRIIDLLDFIPDFRAEPIEHATNGDVMFVRWIARGTGPKGPFEAVGVDRMIVPNGYVAENLILSDHPIFADFARHVGDLRGA